MPSLHAVARSTLLQGVVTQPDRPAGRGQKMRPSPVKRAAAAYFVPVYEPLSLKAFASERSCQQHDLFVLASYGRILPQALLALPQYGALNVHPSLLPAYRGAAPIQSALRNGDTRTGVSIMLMDAGMDTGPLVLQEAVPIKLRDNYGALHDRLAAAGAELLAQALVLAARGKLRSHPQTGAPSVTKPLTKADLTIDWAWSCEQIVNAIRAYSPQPAARATIAGVQVKLLEAEPAPSKDLHADPGTPLNLDGGRLAVACGGGTVELVRLIPASRGPMSGAAFRAWLRSQEP